MKKAGASLLILLAVILSFAWVNSPKGIVSESFDETGCTIEFAQWSGQSMHELSLNQYDELQVDTVCESGDIALDIRDKNGAEAYAGNGLDTGMFTVKAPQAGEYTIKVTGKKATGGIKINLLGD